MQIHFRALLVLVMPSVSLLAQSFTGALMGTVADVSGAVIPQATVVATNVATNARMTAVSDGAGNYTVLHLSPGTYAVEVSAAGFKKYVRGGIVLEVQQQARIDVTLTVGDVAESVTVTEVASRLETTNSTVGKVVDNRAILNLPLNTRNVYSLIYLTPGVAGSIGNNYNSLSYSINGARASLMETVVDGVTGGHPTVQGYSGIAVFPSVDAIDEFKVMGADYSAEFGRSLGSIVNVVYKSGGNRWHGTAYEFLRNSVLDANNFFANSRGLSLDSFKRSQFGGVLSGPVRRDKTFFLVSLEDLRQRDFQSTTTTAPTALQRTGDFSQTFAANGQLIRIFDPFSTRPNPAGSGNIRDQFPGNAIPSSRILNPSRNLAKYLPLPNTTGNSLTNASNYYNAGSHSLNINNYDFRVDHNISDTQKFFVRYSDRYNEDVPATLFPQDIAIAEGRINQQNYMRNFVGNYTKTISPTSILNVRGGFARTLYIYSNQGLGFRTSSLGLPQALDTAGYLPIFPAVSTGGYVGLGNGDHRKNAFMTYSLLADLTKIYGRHTLKVGWEGRMIRVNNHEYRNTSGSYSFGAGFTQGPNPNAASATAGNGFASLLLGTGSGNVIQNFKDVAAQSFYNAFYLQDDLRLSRRLMLNLGLRYDLDTPRTERFNRMNYFDPFAISPLASKVKAFPDLRGGLVFAGANGVGRRQYLWDINNLAPRIGFAYQFNEKTVVRGGWGNFFGVSPQEAHGTVGPFGYRTQYNWVGSVDGITPYDLFTNPFPQGFGNPPGSADGLLTQAGANIQAPLQDTVTPYSMQWNFNIQRELPGRVLLEAAYVGTHGFQLMRNDESGLDINQLDPKYMALGSGLNDLLDNPFYGLVNAGVLVTPKVSRMQLLRPYPQFTSIIPLYSSGSSSIYHALQVSFSKRYSHGLQVEGNYTWSKTLDNGMSHQNSYDIRSSRAVTDFDRTHRFVASYIYELPFGRGRHFGSHAPTAVNWLLGGWQFNGITTFQSGTPLAISASNVSGLGNPTGRANNNGRSAHLDGDIHGRLNRYFDTTVFSQPAPFTFGNVSARTNDLRGSSSRNHDLSLFKEFVPRERLRVQFRAEWLNAFNRVQFGSPNTSVTATNFGVITSQASAPRQTQFGLKVLF
jgi:hypothetical protein